MKTFEECCETIARKYDLGTKLVTGHREKYWTEAAKLFALEKVKEAIPLAREFYVERFDPKFHNTEAEILNDLELKSLPETTTK